ncbi:hypothetical protein ACPF7Z_08970 [Halomonas sp. GXIMD04776]|uniref:hypothetical protein n=1 Tax=Halomonas sp. GXIMD04776 TaxID=3415605 RepID=UPI003C843296
MSIDALARAVTALDNHEIYNPDDELNLLDSEFVSVTDKTTGGLLEQIEQLGGKVLFGPDGGPNRRAITALRKRGLEVSEAGSPYPDNPYETCVVIKIREGEIPLTSEQLGV